MEGTRENHELKGLYGIVNKLERNKSFQNMKSWTRFGLELNKYPSWDLNAQPECWRSKSRSNSLIENILNLYVTPF